MHPLFISIGNIASHIRMAATSHAWRCVAFMPIPKFEVHSEYQTILQTRVWHKCADIVFANLKRAAVHGAIMTDPHGSIRNCYTPLAAWTADLPEQLMISCTAKNASPVTEATHKQFGDAHHYPPRTAELTIQRIHHVGQQTDVWNLDRFQKLAKTMHLSGVSQPFWRDWEYAEPSIFLVPEVLHTCHKFFFDHVLKWCKEVVGKELDSRFKAHHKRISVRHFANGVSHVKQMTGRDHRDIQRTIVPMIAGLVPPDFLRAIRAIIDFIYQSQSPVHTDASIERMESSLREFHTHKDAILRAHGRKTSTGVKDDFFIPKLELLHSFANAVRNNGAIIQYTADVSERLLITHCKHPFERTSKNKDFTTQVTRILDREESMRRFDIYTLLRSSNVALVNAINDEELAVTSANPALAWVSRILPEEQRQIQGPRPCRNYFTGGVLSANAQTALHVTVRSDDMVYSVVDIGTKYHLPDFALQYQRFILAYHHDFQYFLGAFDRFAIWHKFRVQLLSTFRPSMILPSQVVQAKPPSPDIPLGCCDAVLISPGDDAPAFVAQVRAVFQPRLPPRSKANVPPFLEQPLLYVQPFHITCTPEQDPELAMWVIERNIIQSSNPDQHTREGTIVPLQWVSHAVELVPAFGSQAVPSNVGSLNSQEIYNTFFLNHFADKETYNAVHGQGDGGFLDLEYDDDDDDEPFDDDPLNS
ncbi:hypothetical protein BJ138DRAFT_1198890 [Hygrophoropsis aurantiaca]|uniref:Uncharacterized protein n=1 Tax=Hygrophoropsis aurantiaca TaxID=72124 RepID=A0ACB7ZQN1_9AGAM|nr:hypothetical protein BJ138DRAFT_1198890 [Hygrophoropsis aurantiaca]